MAQAGRHAVRRGDDRAAVERELVRADRDAVRVLVAVRHGVGEHRYRPGGLPAVVGGPPRPAADVELERRCAAHRDRLVERHRHLDRVARHVGVVVRTGLVGVGGERHRGDLRHPAPHRQRVLLRVRPARSGDRDRDRVLAEPEFHLVVDDGEAVPGRDRDRGRVVGRPGPDLDVLGLAPHSARVGERVGGEARRQRHPIAEAHARGPHLPHFQPAQRVDHADLVGHRLGGERGRVVAHQILDHPGGVLIARGIGVGHRHRLRGGHRARQRQRHRAARDGGSPVQRNRDAVRGDAEPVRGVARGPEVLVVGQDDPRAVARGLRAGQHRTRPVDEVAGLTALRGVVQRSVLVRARLPDRPAVELQPVPQPPDTGLVRFVARRHRIGEDQPGAVRPTVVAGPPPVRLETQSHIDTQPRRSGRLVHRHRVAERRRELDRLPGRVDPVRARIGGDLHPRHVGRRLRDVVRDGDRGERSRRVARHVPDGTGKRLAEVDHLEVVFGERYGRVCMERQLDGVAVRHARGHRRMAVMRRDQKRLVTDRVLGGEVLAEGDDDLGAVGVRRRAGRRRRHPVHPVPGSGGHRHRLRGRHRARQRQRHRAARDGGSPVQRNRDAVRGDAEPVRGVARGPEVLVVGQDDPRAVARGLRAGQHRTRPVDEVAGLTALRGVVQHSVLVRARLSDRPAVEPQPVPQPPDTSLVRFVARHHRIGEDQPGAVRPTVVAGPPPVRLETQSHIDTQPWRSARRLHRHRIAERRRELDRLPGRVDPVRARIGGDLHPRHVGRRLRDLVRDGDRGERSRRVARHVPDGTGKRPAGVDHLEVVFGERYGRDCIEGQLDGVAVRHARGYRRMLAGRPDLIILVTDRVLGGEVLAEGDDDLGALGVRIRAGRRRRHSVHPVPGSGGQRAVAQGDRVAGGGDRAAAQGEAVRADCDAVAVLVVLRHRVGEHHRRPGGFAADVAGRPPPCRRRPAPASACPASCRPSPPG